ncbi:MAG: MFS transporter [Conchiformibius sp.]|nr:MFS transporter [Conchiformibius sp.]
MAFQSEGYTFKPHEMPMMPGSPASPDLSGGLRLRYLLVGIWLAMAAGLQNGVMQAAQPFLRGILGMDMQQDGWFQAAYYMSYACMSILLFKVRQHFGVQRFVRWIALLMLAAAALQTGVSDYRTALLIRAASGVVASGLLVLAMFYLMQVFTGAKKLAGVMMALGLMLCATPLAQAIVPPLLGNGRIGAVLWLPAVCACLSAAAMLYLPLPPSQQIRALSWTDILVFLLFSGGVALFCAFLVQGRVVWWTSEWLGYLLAGSIALTGTAVALEACRAEPMLDLRWIRMPQILAFAAVGAVVRMLTAEQTVGAAGMLGSLGMDSMQMTGFYTVVFWASLAGVVVGLLRLDVDDIRRPIMIALAGIALAAWWDTGVGVQTRPEQMYWSQALMAFCTLYFVGPMLLEGLVRALAQSTNHIMSFAAVFGLSQTVGGLAGAALSHAFVTVRTKAHLADMAQHLTLTRPQVTAYLQAAAQSYAPQSNDMAVLQSKAAASLITQAAQQASVLAFTDFFAVISGCALAAFVVALWRWGWRRYRKTDVLAAEKAKLMALLKS